MVAAMWLLLCLVVVASANSDRPNIVFLVADDLGWNDVGYNNPDILSPNIDSLAKDGLTLTQSYVQPVCSPSRTAFMTGSYPFTMGLSHMVILPKQAVCVPLDKTFLPQVLKENGYSTHMIGKWHLGFCNWNCTPTYRGFDTFYGYYNGEEDYYSKVTNDAFDFRNNEEVDYSVKDSASTHQYTERARTLIENHNTDNPFFLYLAYQNVHLPLEVPEEYFDLYPDMENDNRRKYSGMVTSMDDSIGDVVQALKDKGIYDNTLIVFSSDNGGLSVKGGGNNFPLRGTKGSIFEGGTRVPAFVHSPLLPKTGETFDGLIHAVDWFPTFVEAAGIDYTDPEQDGLSQWTALTTLDKSSRTELVYNLDHEAFPMEGAAGIRVGDYKLIDGYPGPYQGWYPVPTECHDPTDDFPDAKNIYFSNSSVRDEFLNGQKAPKHKYLFNLREDPEEKTNLYDCMPEKVKELRDRLDFYDKRYVDAMFPKKMDPGANPANYGGVWSPGWC